MAEGGKFIVRQYDGFDRIWIDVSASVEKEEATRIWNEHTANGTKNTKFADIDYYEIFPADTVMLFSSTSGRGNLNDDGNTYEDEI